MSRRTRIFAVALAVCAALGVGLVLSTPRPVVARALSPAESARGAPVESQVELEVGVEASARKRGANVDSAPVALHGKCTTLSGAIVGGRGVVVRLYGPTRKVVSVPVRADGTFTAPVLESGSWRVECNANGYHHAPFSVDARARANAVDVVLEPVRVLDVKLRDEHGGRLSDALERKARASFLAELSVRTRGDGWNLYERPALLPANVDGRLSMLEHAPLEFDVWFRGVPIPNQARVIEDRALEFALDPALLARLFDERR